MSGRLRIGFFGLTHLGIISLLALASKKVTCVGIDLNNRLIEDLKKQQWPIQEPDINETFETAQDFLSFSNNLKELEDCDFVYISQDVPTDNSGKSEIAVIETLVSIAAQNMRKNAKLVVLGQVPPGFTRRMRNYHPNVFYQVETLVFGQAIERAVTPERIIVGVPDPDGPLDTNFEFLLSRFGCPIVPMNYESAEFTKLSINALLASSITTTNSLNEIAKTVGANWSSVKKGLQLDRRIGPYAYLTPGLGISGGNIERDLRSLAELEAKLPGSPELFSKFLSESARQRDWIFKIINSEVLSRNPSAHIGLLGIAYKANTDSTKNALSLDLIRQFPDNIAGVYDPIAILPEELSFVNVFESPLDCIDASNAIVVTTPWEEFSLLNIDYFKNSNSDDFMIIDPYGVIDPRKIIQKSRLITLIENMKSENSPTEGSK